MNWFGNALEIVLVFLRLKEKTAQTPQQKEVQVNRDEHDKNSDAIQRGIADAKLRNAAKDGNHPPAGNG